MTEHAEELARLITLENGKPLADARGEQTYSASFIEWFAAEAMRAYGDHIPATIDGVRNVTIKQPIGVVGIITPWNFPSAMITRKVAAALAAGCTCVIKAPSETPFSALALAKLAEEAGVPKGVINVITTGSSSTVGKILATHPIIKKISFTGSTGVGKV
ncbi:SSDH protein, partial [Spelaeornis formosus]|nr:SSDH protein [Elachura formosa]